MKNVFKIFISIFTILIVCSISFSVIAYSVPSDTIVYTTDTGTKYHRDGCPYLKSKHSKTIKEAEEQGYEPCSRCNPDRETGTYNSNGKSSSSYSGDSSKSNTSNKDSTTRYSNNNSSDSKKTSNNLGTIVFLLVIATITGLSITNKKRHKSYVNNQSSKMVHSVLPPEPISSEPKSSEPFQINYKSKYVNYYFWNEEKNRVSELVITGTSKDCFDYYYDGKLFFDVPYSEFDGKLYTSPEDVPKL